MKRGIPTAGLLLALGGPAAVQAADLWLHVRVEEGEGEERVIVNVPLELVETAIPLIPEEAARHGRVHFDEHDLEVEDLREIWAKLQASPDMTFVTVEEADETVRITKAGGYLLIEARERGDRDEDVDVRVPLRVVEALLSGEADELNVRAAVRALAESGEGELVSVESDGERVRVWIDDSAEGH